MLSETSEVVWKKDKESSLSEGFQGPSGISILTPKRKKNDYSQFEHVKYLKGDMILWWN